MTISRSLHASITSWSLVDPPGAAMYSTPLYTSTQQHAPAHRRHHDNQHGPFPDDPGSAGRPLFSSSTRP